LFHDLEFSGITFRDGHYTLGQVQNALRKVFGHDGTSLLMERLEKALKAAK
jgi:hypothetical protein